MKRLLFIILLLFVQVNTATAQRITRNFQNVSMSDALKYIQQQTGNHKIVFIYNELEDFTITTNVKNKPVPDAIRQIIGFYPIQMIQGDDNDIYVECIHKTEHHLKGMVVDENNLPLPYANVTLLSPADSSMVGGGVTNESGRFVIPNDHGKVIARITYVGYKPAYRLCSRDNVGTIKMQPDATRLNGVVVSASAARLKQEPGKFIYKPSPSELVGIDSYELLRYAPLVSVENNTVSILGKGTSMIYINGRKPLMNNVSLMEMLRSVPADRIDKIEIIMSPNSSHKASTTGGIVNIVMKKNPNEGLTGSASVSATYLGERITPRASLYLGYSKNKLNASANLSYQYYNSQTEKETTYNYRDSYTDILNSSNSQTTGHFLYGNISLSYDLTKRSTLGTSFHIGGSESNSKSATTSSNYLRGTIDKYSKSYAEIENPYRKPEMSIVAYYNLKTDDKGSNLDVSANYSSSVNATMGTMEYASGVDSHELVPYSLFQQNTTVDSYGYEFKGSYNHSYNDGSSLESGYEFDASHLSNDFVRYDHNGKEYVKNEGSSNLFEYDEKVNALYMTYDRKWSDVISTTLGLRAENTNVKGHQVSSNEKFNRNYWNCFPRLSLLVDLANGNHRIALDLSRSIVRPFYNYLNPFKIWTSENTYSMGNIYLKPMIYSDMDLSYRFLGDYMIGASYSYGSDAFSEYRFLAENNTTVSSVANYGNEQSFSLYCNVEKVFFNGIWRMSLNAAADYDRDQGTIDGQDVSYKTWGGEAGIRNFFNLSSRGGIRATLSYNYYTPLRGVLRVGHHKHLLSASFSKEFKFGGTISVDAFNLLNYRPAYHYNTESYAYREKPQTNNISLQIRYTQKFGQSRVRGAQNRSNTNHLGRFKK
ncbi:MAG: outer membrane beta-barrel protein [Muribaculaceae bacterium]|nr:outer membrane beta-barrel protein [Muribaculaceae bacterium]